MAYAKAIMLMTHEKTLVIPDLHGRPEVLRAVLNAYPDAEHFVVAGDFVDGRDTKGVIDILADQEPERMTVLLGNHEWVLGAALYEQDAGNRTIWAENMWRWPYHDGVLRSYGITGSPSLINANRLRDTMSEAHHAVFSRAELFAEGNDYVVVHAGLLSLPWGLQRQYLERKNQLRRMGDYGDGVPVQLSGEQTLTELDIASSGLEKRLITGHWHQPDKKRRIKAEGCLVHLAGLPDTSHISVYETWTGQIKRVDS